MSDHSEFNLKDLHQRKEQTAGRAGASRDRPADAPEESLLPVYRRQYESGQTEPPPPTLEEKPSRYPFDPRRLVAALRRGWLWMLFWALLIGSGAAVFGYWITPHRVSVLVFIKDSTPAILPGMEAGLLRPPGPTAEMLTSLLGSRTLAGRAGEQLHPPMSAQEVLKAVTAERESDAPEKVTLHFTGKDPKKLVDLANVYTAEAAALTKEDQLSEGEWLLGFFRKKLAELDAEYFDLNQRFLGFQREEQLIDPEIEAQAYLKTHGELTLDQEKARIELEMLEERIDMAQATGSDDRLRGAREKLQDLLTRFTDAHPEVVAQKQIIRMLESQVAQQGSAQVAELERQRDLVSRRFQGLRQARDKLQATLSTLSTNGRKYAELKSRLDGLQEARALLADRMRETSFYEDTSLGRFEIPETASLEDISARPRLAKAGSFGAVGFISGLFLAAFTILGREALDDHIKTRADIKRATGLPVLTSLGDLNTMSLLERERWAFRAWTMIAGRLSRSANHGLVCGFISAQPREGRSTWISLLAEAASERGLRVLTVSAGDANGDHSTGGKTSDGAEAKNPTGELSQGARSEAAAMDESSPPTEPAVTAELLPSQAEVSRKLAQCDDIAPVVNVPLPDWHWTPEKRRHWHSALAHWRTIESLVILIELPPASNPEAILLAESIPQLIWLSGSGQARARETRMHLETLRHARCRVAGAVLNREPEPVLA